MSSVVEIEQALENLYSSLDQNRLASGYVIVGAPQGNAKIFAESFLKILFCASANKPCHTCSFCLGVEQKTHPDLFWIEPESKSRVIKVEQIRGLLQQVSQTSYTGGWKAGAIVQADRLNESAANAFLKTLEEPPGRCIFLLITDAPQALLPTIVSRCQRISLETEAQLPRGAWLEPLLDLLRRGSASALDRMGLAHGIKRILEEERKKLMSQEDSEDADKDTVEARVQSKLLNMRADLLHTLLRWHRDLVYCVLGMPVELFYFPEEAAIYRKQAQGLTYQKANANFRVLQTIMRRLDRNVPDMLAFEAGILELKI